jgi:antitoxin (DNA-binding transcriptional repressor) of toxin-antitoxin stability system
MTFSQLRSEFNRIERFLRRGEEIQITKRGRVIARLVPENEQPPAKLPNFRARMLRLAAQSCSAKTGIAIEVFNR